MDETDFAQLSEGSIPLKEWENVSALCEKALMPQLENKATSTQILNGKTNRFLMPRSQKLMVSYVDLVGQKKAAPVDVDAIESINRFSLIPTFRDRRSYEITTQECLDSQETLFKEMMEEMDKEESQETNSIEKWRAVSNSKTITKFESSDFFKKESHLYQYQRGLATYDKPKIDTAYVENLFDKSTYAKLHIKFSKLTPTQQIESRDIFKEAAKAVEDTKVSTRFLLAAVALKIHTQIVKTNVSSAVPVAVPMPVYTREDTQPLAQKFSTKEIDEETINKFQGYLTQLPRSKLDEKKSLVAQYVKNSYSQVEGKNMLTQDKFGNNLFYSCISLTQWKSDQERWAFIDKVFEAAGNDGLRTSYSSRKVREEALEIERKLNPACNLSQVKCKVFAPHLISYLFDPKTAAFRNFAKIKGAPTCFRKCHPADQGSQKQYYEQAFSYTKQLSSKSGSKAFQYFFKYHVDYRNDQWLSLLKDADLDQVKGKSIAIELFSNVISERLFLIIANRISQLKDQQQKDLFTESEVFKQLKHLMTLNFEGWRLAFKAQAAIEKHPIGEDCILFHLRKLLDKKLLANQIVFYGAVFSDLALAKSMIREFGINSSGEKDTVALTKRVMTTVCDHPIDFIFDDRADIEKEIVYLMASQSRFDMSEVICANILDSAAERPLTSLAISKLTEDQEAFEYVGSILLGNTYNVKFLSFKIHQLFQWVCKEKSLDAASREKWLLSMYDANLSRKIGLKKRPLKLVGTCSRTGQKQFYKFSLSYAANQFVANDQAKEAAKSIIDSIVKRAPVPDISSVILRYVADTFQTANAQVKGYCGYLINTVLRGIFTKSSNTEKDTLVRNVYLKKATGGNFNENMILKSVFSSTGSQELSNNEYMQLLAIMNLSQYMALAHNTTFSDVDKLRHFFVGSQIDQINPSLHAELIKIMKLPCTTPSYLKAMCRIFDLNAISLASMPTEEIFSILSKLSDLDFEQLVPVAWSQMNEKAKTATLLAAISRKSLRKLAATFELDTDGSAVKSLWSTTFKDIWPKANFAFERPLYEFISLAWIDLGKIMTLYSLKQMGYSVEKSVQAKEANLSLSEWCVKHAGKCSFSVNAVFQLADQIDQKKGDTNASQAIEKICKSFNETYSLDDIAFYVMIGDAKVTGIESEEPEQVQPCMKSKYTSKLGNTLKQDIMDAWKVTFSEADFSKFEDEASKQTAIYHTFYDIAKNINGVKLSHSDVLAFGLTSSDEILRKAAVYGLATEFPKVATIAKVASEDDACTKLSESLATILQKEISAKHEEAAFDSHLPNLILAFGLMLGSLTKSNQIMDKIMSAAKSLDSTKLENAALVFFMNEGELKKIGTQFNEGACKKANDFCEGILSSQYTLNSKRYDEESNKASYLGIIEIAEKHKNTLGTDPSPLTSNALKLSDVTLHFSDKLIRNIFSGKPDEGLAKFMKACLAYDEMLMDVTYTHLRSFYKKSEHEEIPKQKAKTPYGEKDSFNPFVGQVKNIQVVLQEEKIELKPLEAVLFLQIVSNLVETPQTRPFSKVQLPDLGSHKAPEMNISTKKLFKVRLEDNTYTFDPSAKIHPSYYELQALKIKLERMTRETREKYGEEALKQAILDKSDPFRKKISVIKYADRPYFQSTFGETFDNEPFMNQRFISEYRLYVNVCRILEEYEASCFNGMQPTDIIEQNAVVLGAKLSEQVEEESRSIGVQLYADLPPRVKKA